MGILFRYIVRRYLAVLALCLAGLTTVYLVVDFFEKLRKFLRHDAALSSVFAYFFFKIPEIAVTVTPFAVLMASLLAVGLLNKHHELTAMRSCGAGLFHVTMPFAAVGALTAVLLFGCTAVITPLANARAEYIKMVDIRRKPPALSFRTENLWLRHQADSMMHVQRVDPDGATLRGVTLYRMNDRFHLDTFTSAAGAAFTGGQWVLHHVTQRTMGPRARTQITRVPTMPLRLSLTPDDLKTWLSLAPEQMTLAQLGAHIRHLQNEGHGTAKPRTDYWGRMALAFVPLVMTLLGLAIGLRDLDARAPGLAKNIGKALAIGFVFWAAHVLSVGLGRSGALPPVVAAWMTCAMFLLVGLNLFLKVRY